MKKQDNYPDYIKILSTNCFKKRGIKMELSTLLKTALPIIGTLIIITILASGYVKAPPNKAFIISGLRKKSRILIGQAGIKIPFLERKDELELEVISVDVRTKDSVPTTDFININVDAVANIQVDYISESSHEEGKTGIEQASKNFLNRDSGYIASFVRETLEGNLREVIGTISLETLVQDRQDVVVQVGENVIPDLKKMGIKLITFNIQNFSDENGIITDLGIENTSKIKKTAAIAKAQADKEIAIAKAQADKEANDERIKSELEIERKNQELEIKKAELKAETDVKVAQADAAYKIQEEEERKKVEIATQNAEIAKTEKQRELKEEQVLVQEQILKAEVAKEAEAHKYAEMQVADAELYKRKKEAEARRIEEEERAKGIEAVGKAEADATRLNGIAEAQALEKKAIAMEKFGKAAITEMLVKALPGMATAIAQPLSAIDKVTIIGGNSDGVSDMASNVPTVLAKTIESIKEATGFDMTEVMRADTFEGKTTHNVNLTGLDNPEVATVVSKTAIGKMDEYMAYNGAGDETSKGETPEDERLTKG